MPFFAWLDANSPYMHVFNNYMSAYRAGKISWLDPAFYLSKGGWRTRSTRNTAMFFWSTWAGV